MYRVHVYANALLGMYHFSMLHVTILLVDLITMLIHHSATDVELYDYELSLQSPITIYLHQVDFDELSLQLITNVYSLC